MPERKAPITGIVLAAGMSKRLGRPKQLLDLEGKSLVAHVVDRCLESDLDAVLVVVGHEAGAVRLVLAGRPVRFVDNPRFAQGQGSSLVAGVNAAIPDADAVVVVLGDQPGIDASSIDRLISARRDLGARIAMASYGDDRGHPVLFGSELFDELRLISGDQGGRGVIRRHHRDVVLVPGGTSRVPLDVDTDADYERLLQHRSARDR